MFLTRTMVLIYVSQHSFNYLWRNIVADASGAQRYAKPLSSYDKRDLHHRARLWKTLREESERMKTLGLFSGLAKSHRYRMQLLQVRK